MRWELEPVRNGSKDIYVHPSKQVNIMNTWLLKGCCEYFFKQQQKTRMENLIYSLLEDRTHHLLYSRYKTEHLL